MNPRQRVDSILTALGAKLKRQRKHQVWQLPNGRTFVRASTPSDTRSDANNLRDLRKVVPEAIPAAVIKNPDRKPKVAHGGDGKKMPFQRSRSTVMSSALLASGVVEGQLRARIAIMESELLQAGEFRDQAIQEARNAIDSAHAWSIRCPICRFRKFIQNSGRRRP